MNKIYAGIGSRETPDDILIILRRKVDIDDLAKLINEL